MGKLKRKLGALKFASKFSTYKTRLKLANGCIMSVITYGIQVWGIHCTTMRDRKEVWIYLFVYCIDNLIKGYSNYFYISMKNLRSDINVEINTPREH